MKRMKEYGKRSCLIILFGFFKEIIEKKEKKLKD